MADLENETELLDYDETEETTTEVVAEKKKDVKGSYVSIHSSGFRDFLLKDQVSKNTIKIFASSEKRLDTHCYFPFSRCLILLESLF